MVLRRPFINQHSDARVDSILGVEEELMLDVVFHHFFLQRSIVLACNNI